MTEDPGMQTPYVEHASTVTDGFAAIEFAENPEPRVPCLLLLDTSGSMIGTPVAELNTGIQTFKDELLGDPLAAKTRRSLDHHVRLNPKRRAELHRR